MTGFVFKLMCAKSASSKNVQLLAKRSNFFFGNLITQMQFLYMTLSFLAIFQVNKFYLFDSGKKCPCRASKRYFRVKINLEGFITEKKKMKEFLLSKHLKKTSSPFRPLRVVAHARNEAIYSSELFFIFFFFNAAFQGLLEL